MVIIRTSATEVKTQAVSPELLVHFSRTVAEQLGGAAAAAGAAAAGAGAAGVAGAAAAGAASVAGAAAGGLFCAIAAGAARPMNMAVASANAGVRPVNKRVSFMVQDSESGRGSGAWRLKRVLVRLASADPDRRVEAVDEDLAVADLACARRGDDCFDHLVGDVRVDRDLDFQLGKEAHGVFGAAIDLGMPLLPPVALDLSHCQPVHSDGGERIAHLLQLERLYDRHYDFHKPRPIVTRCGGVRTMPLPCRETGTR